MTVALLSLGGTTVAAAAAPGPKVRSAAFSASAVPRNPQQALAKMPRAVVATEDTPPPTRACPPDDPNCFTPSAGRVLSAFLQWTTGDVNRFWGRAVRAAGLKWVAPRSIQISSGRRARSRCAGGPVTSASAIGPFYCEDDGNGTIYLPLLWLKRFIFPRSEFTAEDFALAYVVAHEAAHHLQGRLGILADRKLTSMQIELQADCLAGVWARSTWARGLLEAGDIEKAIRLARRIGDVPGTPANDPTAHGSARLRVSWFTRGYTTGSPAKCRTY
ncbi:MAG: neutral zinc metallopeptidase [Actinomycetota bacterium]|nr:neutral zinc metallopeptidase [Actinomycetota bacterium]